MIKVNVSQCAFPALEFSCCCCCSSIAVFLLPFCSMLNYTNNNNAAGRPATAAARVRNSNFENERWPCALAYSRAPSVSHFATQPRSRRSLATCCQLPPNVAIAFFPYSASICLRIFHLLFTFYFHLFTVYFVYQQFTICRPVYFQCNSLATSTCGRRWKSQPEGAALRGLLPRIVFE